MKSIISFVIAIAVVYFVSGCGTPGPLDLAAINTENRIAPSDIVLVAVDPSVMGRVDRSAHPPIEIATGPVWRSVFVGPQDGAKFTITTASITQSVAGAGSQCGAHTISPAF
jgi:hypothetical protein